MEVAVEEDESGLFWILSGRKVNSEDSAGFSWSTNGSSDGGIDTYSGWYEISCRCAQDCDKMDGDLVMEWRN